MEEQMFWGSIHGRTMRCLGCFREWQRTHSGSLDPARLMCQESGGLLGRGFSRLLVPRHHLSVGIDGTAVGVDLQRLQEAYGGGGVVACSVGGWMGGVGFRTM